MKKKEKVDPYIVIDRFFSDPLDFYVTYMYEMFKAANTEGCWQGHSMSNLVFITKLIKGLVEAAHNLMNEEPLRINASIIPASEVEKMIIDPSLYHNSKYNQKSWDCFPRHLSKEEFVNPVLAIRNFFENKDLTDRYDDLDEIFEYAISKGHAGEGESDLNFWTSYYSITKLIEAAHLVLVRAIELKVSESGDLIAVETSATA